MSNILERAKNILRLSKGEELLFWILHKIMEIIFFSVTVHQCNVAFGVVHVQLYFKFSFCLLLYFVLAG